MRQPFTVVEEDVAGHRAEGDTVLEKLVLDRSTGSELLEQRILRFGPGRSLERGGEDCDEVLYVVAGSGILELDGEPYELGPDMGAYIRAGERWAVENEGPEELLVVAVTVPAGADHDGERHVTVRFADRPELRADENRTFRTIFDADSGARHVTQFVGIVEPCRAPDHSHSYDEVGYILEGKGLVHMNGESIALSPGSCFHLPPGQVHCIENVGPGTMRILGVFHPSGDPASRSYEAAASATS
jgi:mannose-6-phosphate isomerase-like protein (cupin superfamily)